MKTTSRLLITLFIAFGFMACDKDNDIRISEEANNALMDRYPGANRIEWETKGMYFVADFIYNNKEYAAWFDINNNWHMSESELGFAELPESVRNAHSTGEYTDWKIEDISKVERKEMEVLYMIEVESGKQEYYLFYSEDGSLIKAVPDSDHAEFLPAALPQSVLDFLNGKYPGYRILDIEKENNVFEVDLLENNIHREVHFNMNYEWCHTKTELADLPDNIKDILNVSEYVNYHIDDCDFIDTPTENYYLIELENSGRDIYIKVYSDGRILPV